MSVKNLTDLQQDINVKTVHPDYKAEIVDIIRGNLTPGLKRDRLLTYHENDIAVALEPVSYTHLAYKRKTLAVFNTFLNGRAFGGYGKSRWRT